MKSKHHLTQHHHYHLDKLIKDLIIFLVIIIVVGSAMTTIEKKVTQDIVVHKNCVNACYKEVFRFVDESEVGYDRTQCIKSCNTLLK